MDKLDGMIGGMILQHSPSAERMEAVKRVILAMPSPPEQIISQIMRIHTQVFSALAENPFTPLMIWPFAYASVHQ